MGRGEKKKAKDKPSYYISSSDFADNTYIIFTGLFRQGRERNLDTTLKTEQGQKLPVARMIVWQHRPPNVHCVCSLTDQNAVLWQKFPDVVEYCIVIHELVLSQGECLVSRTNALTPVAPNRSKNLPAPRIVFSAALTF